MKSLTEFGFANRRLDIRRGKCQVCYKAYQKAHYDANQPKYVAKAKRWNDKMRLSNREKLIAYLLEHPCVDCGEDDIRVLDFDHRDRDTKIICISVARRSYTWERLLIEIEKCEIRCANCHRIRTSDQLGWWNY